MQVIAQNIEQMKVCRRKKRKREGWTRKNSRLDILRNMSVLPVTYI